MRLIVGGTRSYNDSGKLQTILNLAVKGEENVVVYTGAAKGADKLAQDWASQHWFTVKNFHPDWRTYGKKAGPMRNREMVKEAILDAEEQKEDIFAVVFWDGESDGTKNLLSVLREKDIPTKIVRYNQ